MKATTAYAIVWISSAIAISTGIFITESLVALWALLIPALVSGPDGTEK
ncbi:hypothetical protein [Salimicrobium halophilum]|uniref:Uncharacterized protein n=1 Tax=Salimicrobium halophilum TaxID=86666 RepID=A0A1G8WEC2_9BACI|nr:hypothetical protein [Salimicrobium halophilum]SDJ76709.1 hypothetical protein SAMN04490247_3157 [Salimicrobium halophilum]